MTDLAAIRGALDREHRTNLPAHFLIAADHPARLECSTCALLADTADVGRTHVSTPSVEPLDVDRLTEAIRTSTWDAIHDTLNPPNAERQAHDMATRIATTYAGLRPSVEPLDLSCPKCGVEPAGLGALQQIETIIEAATYHRDYRTACLDIQKLVTDARRAALLPTQASDSPEKP